MEPDAELSAFCADEWPRLVGSLAYLTGERDLAEELAQETLIRVCEHWPQVRSAESRSAWAYRVASNLAKSRFRRRATFRRVGGLAATAASAVEPDTALAVAVRRAVSALPDQQRKILVLRYFADLSVRDVASVMRCPENTVKTHTRRAIAALRDAGLTDVDTPEPTPIPAEGTR